MLALPLIQEGLEPFMGLAADLLPILFDLITALKTRTQIEQDRTNAIDAGLDGNAQVSVRSAILTSDIANIRFALLDWKPNHKGVSRSQIDLAKAYEFAISIVLDRDLLQQPRGSNNVQRAVGVALQSCQKAIDSREPLVAFLWPLFIAACEANTREQQDAGDDLLSELEKRTARRSVFIARKLCHDVWDHDDPNISWQSVAQTANVEIFFC